MSDLLCFENNLLSENQMYFSVVESNIIYLLDELLADKFTSNDAFEQVKIEKDNVYFRWTDKEAVIEFNAYCDDTKPWQFVYQHVIDDDVKSLGETVCNYDIVLRLTELTNQFWSYEVTPFKNGYGFDARIVCKFNNETPHVSFFDEKKNLLGHVRLNDQQSVTKQDLHYYKCKCVEGVSVDQLLHWANGFNSTHHMTHWELAHILWDISSKNKRPINENNHNQNLVRLNDCFDEYEYDFE